MGSSKRIPKKAKATAGDSASATHSGGTAGGGGVGTAKKSSQQQHHEKKKDSRVVGKKSTRDEPATKASSKQQHQSQQQTESEVLTVTPPVTETDERPVKKKARFAEVPTQRENKAVLRTRMAKSQLNPVEVKHTAKQAFSIFAIPVVLDTNLLSVRELRQELKIRDSRVDGNKELLRKRLDAYVLQHEKERVKDHSGRTSTEIKASVATSTGIESSSLPPASSSSAKSKTKKNK